MKYLGVIGYPLEHSLSPIFQQAALDHLRLDILYESWPTPPDGLNTRVIGLRAPAVLGANVTIPHKEAVLQLVDEVDDLARDVGAVNTVANIDGKLRGYNTDVVGFLRALRDHAAFDPGGCNAVVVGAGGAARAVVVALIQEKAASVTVVNRTRERASLLIDDLQPIAGDTVLRAQPDERSSWDASLDSCDLLVNCTPIGASGSPDEEASPVPVDLLRESLLVYDLIYRPAETPLMNAALRAGSRALGGLPMLVYQGAASFELWTGREAPLDIMFTAGQEALSATGARGD